MIIINLINDRNVIPDKEVTVAITPNGYADGLAKNDKDEMFFVMPEERDMLMSDFLDHLEHKRLVFIILE